MIDLTSKKCLFFVGLILTLLETLRLLSYVLPYPYDLKLGFFVGWNNLSLLMHMASLLGLIVGIALMLHAFSEGSSEE